MLIVFLQTTSTSLARKTRTSTAYFPDTSSLNTKNGEKVGHRIERLRVQTTKTVRFHLIFVAKDLQ